MKYITIYPDLWFVLYIWKDKWKKKVGRKVEMQEGERKGEEGGKQQEGDKERIF